MQMCSLLGIPIAAGKSETLFEEVRALVGVGGRVYTVNPLMLSEATRDSAFHEVLRRATLCIPDGVGVKCAMHRRGVATDVLCGVDLCASLPTAGTTAGFLGGKAGVCEAAFSHLCKRVSGFDAAFLCDGYGFDLDEIAQRLSQTKPTFFFVCLGTPRQEFLIDRLSPLSPTTLCIGLGGSFDVLSGRVKRAPAAVRKMGCEWLFRMIYQPKRLGKVPKLCRFARMVIKEEKIECTKKRQDADAK